MMGISKKEKAEATTYQIVRTGNKYQRHYRIEKYIMGVYVEAFNVRLKGMKEIFCDCPGFHIQKFPKIEHKHVKIAQDFHKRGEPANATYKIHGAGAVASIEYLSEGQTEKGGDQ